MVTRNNVTSAAFLFDLQMEMHNCVQTTSECWVRCDGCAPRVKRTVSFYFHLLVRMFEWLFSSSSSASSLRPSEIIARYFLGWLKSGICSEPKRSGRIEFPHVSARNIWTSLLFSRNFHCRAAVSPFVMAIWTLLDRIFTIHTQAHADIQLNANLRSSSYDVALTLLHRKLHEHAYFFSSIFHFQSNRSVKSIDLARVHCIVENHFRRKASGDLARPFQPSCELSDFH